MSLKESQDGYHEAELFEYIKLTMPRGYTT